MKNQHVAITFILSCAAVAALWIMNVKEIKTSMFTISSKVSEESSMNSVINEKPIFKNEFFAFVVYLMTIVFNDGFWFIISLALIYNARLVLIAHPDRDADISFRWWSFKFYTNKFKKLFVKESEKKDSDNTEDAEHEEEIESNISSSKSKNMDLGQVLYSHEPLNAKIPHQVQHMPTQFNQNYHQGNGNYRNRKRKKGR